LQGNKKRDKMHGVAIIWTSIKITGKFSKMKFYIGNCKIIVRLRSKSRKKTWCSRV
jgi:hypothetical protein